MIVKVIVDIPAAQVNRSFDYTVPEIWQSMISLGVRVNVPFGNIQRLGFVVDIVAESDFSGELREISQVLDYESFINEELLQLSEYLADYLQEFRINILKAMLPSMLRAKYRKIFVVHQPHDLLDDFIEANEIVAEDLESKLSRQEIQSLLKEAIMTLEYRVESKTTVKQVAYINRTMPIVELQQQYEQLPTRQLKMRTLLSYLIDQKEVSMTKKQVIEDTKVTTKHLKLAEELGYITITYQQTYRDPLAHLQTEQSQARTLRPQQAQAYDTIRQAMFEQSATTFLLEGVTGSGKTEIYLQLMAQARDNGQSALLLVPEISLTPQMVSQVLNRFGSGVAVLHSGLSIAEKYDEWQRIIRGEATIVVGARSSIFAPLTQLGLIIMDEEHESTYKQSEAPRYHARDVALWRSQYYHCPLVLGSATPSLESRARAELGRYQHIRMSERVNSRPLPPVEIVDMTQEIGRKTQDELSSVLKMKIADRLAKHEQIVLLLNRRGYASYFLCRECGYVIGCPRCDVSLTYHKTENRLKCHYCDYYQSVPTQCPSCHGQHLRHYGLGTQKIEELLQEQFPQARIIRMDMDTTKRKGQHEQLLNQFKEHQADILLGTQMIAKGLDFEKVTLVGVINADTALNLPDFRASERTFQLLTQVAGRTGRGRYPGEVVIQTYNPEHYVMQLAQQHDYNRFFYYEMKRRHLGHYPPYYYTTLISVSSKKQALAQQVIYQLKMQLVNLEGTIDVLGPSQGSIAKINEQYYFQLFIKYKQREQIQKKLQEILEQSQKEAKYGVKITIDHEPLYVN